MFRDFFKKVVNPHHDRGVDVWIQDQTSEIVDLLLIDVTLKTETTAVSAIDSKTITVENATGITGAGNFAVNIITPTRLFQSVITNVTGTTITFTSPLDMEVPIGTEVHLGNFNLSLANGSSTTKKFTITPPHNVDWDITNITCNMIANSVMYDTKFGPLTALTNGIVLRVENGITKNIFNARTNGILSVRMNEAEYPDKVPSGTYGFRAVRYFAGQENNGVTIRLHGSTEDTLEVLVQDNLINENFVQFIWVAQGHVVE